MAAGISGEASPPRLRLRSVVETAMSEMSPGQSAPLAAVLCARSGASTLYERKAVSIGNKGDRRWILSGVDWRFSFVCLKTISFEGWGEEITKKMEDSEVVEWKAEEEN